MSIGSKLKKDAINAAKLIQYLIFLVQLEDFIVISLFQ